MTKQPHSSRMRGQWHWVLCQLSVSNLLIYLFIYLLTNNEAGRRRYGLSYTVNTLFGTTNHYRVFGAGAPIYNLVFKLSSSNGKEKWASLLSNLFTNPHRADREACKKPLQVQRKGGVSLPRRQTSKDHMFSHILAKPGKLLNSQTSFQDTHTHIPPTPRKCWELENSEQQPDNGTCCIHLKGTHVRRGCTS